MNASLILKMSAIVTGVLKLTFGFLANKIRSEVATRLEDGDVTKERCWRLIVRELDHIKSKLDGLGRKDLSSSLLFLQEGINRLDHSFSQLDSNEDTAAPTEQATLVEAASSRDTDLNSSINEAGALIDAIMSSGICSNDRFKTAVESFKLAREKATEAFSNETLSIEDRIQASQIRMMARILESLEDPDGSVSDCLQYLKQLHDIGAIQEIFSALIDGGFKSRFNKAKRLDTATSVHQMNEILFKFARKYTKSSVSVILRDWPTILFCDPTYEEDHHVEKPKESAVQINSQCSDFSFGDKIRPEISVVNSKAEILALTENGQVFKIFKPSGESRTLCEAPRENHAANCFEVAIDIDAKDNIYVITTFRGYDRPRSFQLFKFDENGNKKLGSPLPFLCSKLPLVRMAINKDGRIAILNWENKTLYIGNVCVELNLFMVEKSLRLKQLDLCPLSLRFQSALNDETKIIAVDSHTVYIYTGNGQLQRKIKMKKEINIRSFALNEVTKRFLAKTYHGSESCSVLRFSATGELIDSLCLGSSEWITDSVLTSHPNGLVALVSKTKATLLQL